MTLQELVNETLVEKHKRLMREKCRHGGCYSSTVMGPVTIFTNACCLDCGRVWHTETKIGADA
jgi:hypothetical protein